MTNYEKIKQMTIEEMAEFVLHASEAPCWFCRYKNGCQGHEVVSCYEGVEAWLESEAADDT